MVRRVLITGLHGTVAPYLRTVLERNGYQVIGFDRTMFNLEDRLEQKKFVESNNIYGIFHLAMGSEFWASRLASIAVDLDIPFVFTSTESVFSDRYDGPYKTDQSPDSDTDYGSYKIRCEREIVASNPEACIVRLGWQIGASFQKNNMLNILNNLNKDNGKIEASTEWYPACSYIEDTVEELYKLFRDRESGIFHIEGNPGYTFYEIVKALNDKYQCEWNIEKTTVPHRDGRLFDDRVGCRSIAEFLEMRVKL